MCRSLLLYLVCWWRTMYTARAERRNQPVPQSGRHGAFSTHHRRIGLGNMQCCCCEGAAAVICLFRLCRVCCGRQSRRQSVRGGSGAREVSKGATPTHPWARRCLNTRMWVCHVGFCHYLGGGLYLKAWDVALWAGACPCKPAMHESAAQICWALKYTRRLLSECAGLPECDK